MGPDAFDLRGFGQRVAGMVDLTPDRPHQMTVERFQPLQTEYEGEDLDDTQMAAMMQQQMEVSGQPLTVVWATTRHFARADVATTANLVNTWVACGGVFPKQRAVAELPQAQDRLPINAIRVEVIPGVCHAYICADAACVDWLVQFYRTETWRRAGWECHAHRYPAEYVLRQWFPHMLVGAYTWAASCARSVKLMQAAGALQSMFLPKAQWQDIANLETLWPEIANEASSGGFYPVNVAMKHDDDAAPIHQVGDKMVATTEQMQQGFCGELFDAIVTHLLVRPSVVEDTAADTTTKQLLTDLLRMTDGQTERVERIVDSLPEDAGLFAGDVSFFKDLARDPDTSLELFLKAATAHPLAFKWMAEEVDAVRIMQWHLPGLAAPFGHMCRVPAICTGDPCCFGEDPVADTGIPASSALIHSRVCDTRIRGLIYEGRLGPGSLSYWMRNMNRLANAHNIIMQSKFLSISSQDHVRVLDIVGTFLPLMCMPEAFVRMERRAGHYKKAVGPLLLMSVQEYLSPYLKDRRSAIVLQRLLDRHPTATRHWGDALNRLTQPYQYDGAGTIVRVLGESPMLPSIFAWFARVAAWTAQR